ncbi:MerR family transcriptional regulator [Candidatus Xianfuyuplasma coldseepsis]|uniref:MerR family transcriptional regulator n=1 Tax=Candidatus Xianfuyuplasma coldseepsis TaxID=2782163 RepID=A0A7L7KUH7_9MOLU|nr:MerR family transcriptional regulator [Xianfuyuplasma coldseepsis]QMS85942.1 MerR family transcriptional regulator [Xianfuyuplasma coldseepsis]
MEYKIHEVAQISGVTTRTLRYYDKIGLLQPQRIRENNYRIYDDTSISKLQIILLYRNIGLSLADIKQMISSRDFDYITALERHRQKILEEQKKLHQIISTIDQTIASHKGGKQMSNQDKFYGLKEEIIAKNEEDFGDEIRAKYSAETINQSYQKMRKMSKWQWQEAERIGALILEKLPQAMNQGIDSDTTKRVCELHKEWIQFYWPTYDQQAHVELVKMYTVDERFTAYYDAVKPGAAHFLYQAIKHYINDLD